MDIANDTKLHRDTVARLCKCLQMDDYIFRKNKQSEYHITNKVYAYPELTAFSFGTRAIRTISDDIQRGRGQVTRSNPNYNAVEAKRDQQTLHEFAARLGAIIEYILIQALRPKKISPGREEDELIDLYFILSRAKTKMRYPEDGLKMPSNPRRYFLNFAVYR
jgi:hypothetical protein